MSIFLLLKITKGNIINRRNKQTKNKEEIQNENNRNEYKFN